jgi:5-methylcytosine-specific restriction endonuclease McrA
MKKRQRKRPAVRKRSQAENKRTLIKRDGPYCYFCKQEFPSEELTVDHMIPLSAGGPNHIDNKVLACYPHQDMKGNQAHWRILKK